MIVTTLILNIFPENSSKKYIKLFAGFLLLMLIFNPIVKYKKQH
ncbi:MAG: stage III sporulation protein AF [Eubacterium sp.]